MAFSSFHRLVASAMMHPTVKEIIPTHAQETMKSRPGSVGSEGIDCMIEQLTWRDSICKSPLASFDPLTGGLRSR